MSSKWVLLVRCSGGWGACSAFLCVFSGVVVFFSFIWARVPFSRLRVSGVWVCGVGNELGLIHVNHLICIQELRIADDLRSQSAR